MNPGDHPPQGLYFHYLATRSGRRGPLVYVGISTNWAKRLVEHWEGGDDGRGRKPYLFRRLPLIVRHVPFPPDTTREEAESIEAAHINHYRPIFNIQHNPSHASQKGERDLVYKMDPSSPGLGLWLVGRRGWVHRVWWAGRAGVVGFVVLRLLEVLVF